MAGLVIIFLIAIGWEPLYFYGILGKVVGIVGFALGNYIFSTNMSSYKSGLNDLKNLDEQNDSDIENGLLSQVNTVDYNQ